MSLFNELKRRNVFKVAAAYTVVAWLLLQVSDTLVPALHLPGWFHSGVAFLLILGFPVAMIFAWAFEMTPEGLKKEKDIDRSKSITHITSRKLDYTIIAALVLALGYFAYDKFVLSAQRDAILVEATTHAVSERASTDTDPTGEPVKSIAVLPFVNMSDDASNEYFADGISEELLNVLAKYPGLRVAARTSSFQFKGQSPDIADIAEKLHVNHVLEGSVRKSGNRLRITAQLIETKTGFHLWSETYDRELTDVFAIQDEISAAIGAALKIQLALDDGSGQTSPTVTATASTAAFEAYMQGRQLVNRRGRNNLEQAVTHLERALALDETYAPAHAQLAIAISLQLGSAGGYGDLTLEEVERRAMPHIQRAFDLDNRLPEAFAARAIYSLLNADFTGVIENAERVLELNPSYADVINWSYIAHARMGQHVEAVGALERLLEVDPLSVAGRSNLAPVLASRGQIEAAFAMADSIAGQNLSVSYVTHGSILLVEQGQPAAALEWFLQGLAVDPQAAFPNGFTSRTFGIVDLLPEALRLRKDMHHYAYRNLTMWPELLAGQRQGLADDPSNTLMQVYLADALHLSGEVDQAQVLYEDLISRFQGRVIRDTDLISGAPMARAVLGRWRAGDLAGATALAELARADHHQLSLAGRHDGEYYRVEAILEAIEGNEVVALHNIQKAIDTGLRDRSVFSEPAFEAFHDSQEFMALELKLDAFLVTEREKALQMMCFNNPVSEVWQPLPETCEGVEESP